MVLLVPVYCLPRRVGYAPRVRAAETAEAQRKRKRQQHNTETRCTRPRSLASMHIATHCTGKQRRRIERQHNKRHIHRHAFRISRAFRPEPPSGCHYTCVSPQALSNKPCYGTQSPGLSSTKTDASTSSSIANGHEQHAQSQQQRPRAGAETTSANSRQHQRQTSSWTFQYHPRKQQQQTIM